MNTRKKLATLALIPALSAVAYVGSAFAADTTTTSPAASSATYMQKGYHGPRDSTQFATDLASVLGLNAADVKAKLDAGTKPSDIITSSGKTEADVQAQMKALHESEMKAHIAADVASGKLTQTQADTIITNMANHKGMPFIGMFSGRHADMMKGMHNHNHTSTQTNSTTTSTQ